MVLFDQAIQYVLLILTMNEVDISSVTAIIIFLKKKHLRLRKFATTGLNMDFPKSPSLLGLILDIHNLIGLFQ